MNVLVVGGAGFVGSHLVDRLLAEGHAVDVVDDLSSGSLANLADARSFGGALKFHHLSVESDGFAEIVGRRHPQAIVHLAALTPSQRGPQALEAALVGVLRVLEAARRHGVAKVVVTLPAIALYGEVPAKEQPVKEGHGGEVTTLEGVAATSIVRILEVYRDQHALEFTALALANVYGPRQRPEDGVVAAFRHAVAERRPPVLHGDGRQSRDFVYVDDTVDAVVRSLERGGGLVINVGTGQPTTIRDLLELISRPDTPAAVLSTRRPGDVDRLVVSPVRARIQLSWAPWTSLDEVV
jgi:UDP-glucose 4-epimerase